MSAAPAPAPAADAAPAKGGGKKKLIIIIAAVVALAGGGGGFFMMKKKAADAEAAAAAEEGEDGGGHGGGHAAPKPAAHAPAAKAHDNSHPPVFVPLDPFTVNLADRESERYAQVAVTLEVEDAKVGDQLKNYMPAIRSNILMLLAHKTAAQMLSPEGKARLALEIKREALIPLGVEMELDDEEDEAAAAAEDHAPAKNGKKKKKKKRIQVEYPIKGVHFANLIVQ